jgi:hypothetical protein
MPPLQYSDLLKKNRISGYPQYYSFVIKNARTGLYVSSVHVKFGKYIGLVSKFLVK